MEEHTREARLPHINGDVVRKWDISGDKGGVPCEKLTKGNDPFAPSVG